MWDVELWELFVLHDNWNKPSAISVFIHSVQCFVRSVHVLGFPLCQSGQYHMVYITFYNTQDITQLTKIAHERLVREVPPNYLIS